MNYLSAYNKFKFYKMVDGRDNTIRYIGQTKKSLDTRLSAHLRGAFTKKTYKEKWIKDMAASGYSPDIVLLEEKLATGYSALNCEKRWIYYHRLQGHPLTNSTHNNPIILNLLNSTTTDILNSDVLEYTEYAASTLTSYHHISTYLQVQHTQELLEFLEECRKRVRQLSDYGKLPQVITDRITSAFNPKVFEQLQEGHSYGKK